MWLDLHCLHMLSVYLCFLVFYCSKQKQRRETKCHMSWYQLSQGVFNPLGVVQRVYVNILSDLRLHLDLAYTPDP